MSSYILQFSKQAKEDIRLHKKPGNRAITKKITSLLNELTQHPFTGTGKPEQLRYSLTRCWTQRINHEHRLIYEVTDSIVSILSAYGHYE